MGRLSREKGLIPRGKHRPCSLQGGEWTSRIREGQKQLTDHLGRVLIVSFNLSNAHSCLNGRRLNESSTTIYSHTPKCSKQRVGRRESSGFSPGRLHSAGKLSTTKCPSRCSQNRRLTHAFFLRRPHSCSSVATSLPTIDLGTLQMFFARHSLVTGRPSFSVPCTFGPRTLLFFTSSLFRFFSFTLSLRGLKRHLVKLF
jgi:hypothetical protein